MKIGCHAVLFGPRIANETEFVLSSLHETGAEGAEMGARFFGLERSDYLMNALTKTGMELSGLHVSIFLASLLDDLESAEKAITDAALFLSKTDCRNIILTCLVKDRNAENSSEDNRFQDLSALKAMAEALNEIATTIYEKYSVRINYHNHNWEFKNDAAIYEALINYAPNLYFALDTGWAAISGYDPVKLIERLKGRINYVHLRDCLLTPHLTEDFETLQKNAFVPVGTGDMDYKALIETLKNTLNDEGWAVIEYEVGEQDFDRYRKAIEYIKPFL